MTIYVRTLEKILTKDLQHFPIITLTGPRQSGKSTLLRMLLKDWKYVNLEDPGTLDFALSDPKGFIKTHSGPTILDEIQRAPKILSQIQVSVDEQKSPGRFALTGSDNLLLLEEVSQSLAGRTAVRNLLPFSYEELSNAGIAALNLEQALFLGGYPVVHSLPEASASWLDSYIQTYIERDVRLIRNVSDLSLFRRFLRLAAGRVGQLLDFSGIGSDLGVSHNTIRDWIGVLEAGFIAFRLPPYFKNFSKRIIKSPKLYFYDTGVLCRLLDVRSPADLQIHPFRGAIFENWCITEALKAYVNRGRIPSLYFWRDQQMEVDLLLERSATDITALELKSGQTINAEAIQSALKLKSIAKNHNIYAGVVYGGDESQERSSGSFIPWEKFGLSAGDLI